MTEDTVRRLMGLAIAFSDAREAYKRSPSTQAIYHDARATLEFAIREALKDQPAMTRDEAIALYGRVFRKRHGIGPVTPAPEIVIDGLLEAANSPAIPDGSQGGVQGLTDAEIREAFRAIRADEDESMVFDLHDFTHGARWAERTLCAKHGLKLKE